jgi:hypothetical protein
LTTYSVFIQLISKVTREVEVGLNRTSTVTDFNRYALELVHLVLTDIGDDYDDIDDDYDYDYMIVI